MADLPALLAECDRVLEGVTPGPWLDGESDHGEWLLVAAVEASPPVICRIHNTVNGKPIDAADRANAAFIAAARTLLPALVAALRTPPSEEEWAGLERAHGSGCHLTLDDGNCACGADAHNARVTALRAKVEAERESLKSEIATLDAQRDERASLLNMVLLQRDAARATVERVKALAEDMDRAGKYSAAGRILAALRGEP